MFQCKKHIEMNKFLCSLVCTWVTIIDSQFNIIDSLSLDIPSNKILTWLLPGCICSGDHFVALVAILFAMVAGL